MPGHRTIKTFVHLQTHFFVRGQVAKAVDDVSLTIESEQTLGLVGESDAVKV